MSRSIRSILSDSVNGPTGTELSWDEVGAWLRKTVFSESERAQRKLAQRRQEFFEGGGDRYLSEMVAKVFQDPEVRNKRDQWVPMAKTNNVWRRIIQEKATVYNVRAIRSVGAKDQDNFDRLLDLCRFNDMAKRWNEWGELQNTLACGFRVRSRDEKKQPLVEVVSRDSFFALGHPYDATDLVAIGIRISTALTDAGLEGKEMWEVWTDHERFYCDQNGYIDKSNVWEHGWARMPWMLYSKRPPAGCLIDHKTGAENDAAHMVVWFEKILELKESKSATKIPIIAGDTTRDARDQAAESENPLELKDGTTAYVLDTSMDLKAFRDAGDATFETAGANNGIAPNVLKHQGVQSAQARELMRAPLKELRREQEDYLRQFEREFVELMAMVVARDLSELSFSTEEWSIDFQERATALDPKEEDEVFEARRRMGLTSTIREVMKRNPDLSRDQAVEFLVANIADEYFRNVLMRPLQAVSGSMAMQQPDTAASPQVAPTSTGESEAGLRAIPGGVNANQATSADASAVA